MKDLLNSRKFWTVVVGVAAIVKVPPFSSVDAALQAKIVGALLVAYVLGTALESGLQALATALKK